jgi:hypothetical protein
MKKILLIAILATFGLSLNAQNHKCGTMKNWEQKKEKDPNTELRMQQLEIITQEWIKANKGQKNKATITIPVVVHVIYHTSTENISDAQVSSQIEVLNEDFRLLNFDRLPESHPFWVNRVDCQIEFCLAQQDPNGNSTNGITRTYTDSTSFIGEGYEKADIYGGKDNWEPTEYLNLWVCNLDGSGGTLGYAVFPSDLTASPEKDGIVIDFRAFGDIGTAGTGVFDDNDLGRTATHEIGHWLNLRHIWGDEECGDDFCADTPEHEGANYGCPTFPNRSYNVCTSGTSGDGEMYMNYMDYVNDNCMVMFTSNQSDRMGAALLGARSGLLTSDGCSTPLGIYSLNKSIDVNLYPNPSKGSFFIDVQSEVLEDISITVNNILGEIVYQYNKQNVVKLDNFRIDINNKSNGIYFVNITVGNNVINKKIILSK